MKKTLDVAPLPPRNSIAAVWLRQPLDDYLGWRSANLEAAIAVHEAGHAVLMHAFGVPGIHAKVHADGTSGVVEHTAAQFDHDNARASLRVERLAALGLGMIFHAGIAAEMLLWRGAAAGELQLPETSDHASAAASFGDLFPRHPHGFCQALARHVLAASWPRVEVIASALREKGEWLPDDVDVPGALPGFERAQLRAVEALAYLEGRQG